MEIGINLFMKKNSHRGFTLIELLVVIAIISVLSALLLANFVGVRQRGRDGQRKSDLRQIQSALELIRSDTGAYLAALPACGAQMTGGGSNTTVYMQKVPCDPLSASSYTYTPDANNFTYTIIACLENDNDSQKDTSKQGVCTTTSYTLTNP